MTVERLRAVPLFECLSDEDLEPLASRLESIDLAPGEQLFAEGDPADRAFLISTGEIEILKRTGSRQTLLTVRRADEVIGEMALVHESRRTATARARVASQVVSIPRKELDALVEARPTVLRALFEVLLRRWMATEDAIRHNSRMAQLGTLTAGVAHEINNPTAAARRAAAGLGPAIEALRRAERNLLQPGPTAESEIDRLDALTGDTVTLDALDRADREDALAARLGAAGYPDAHQLAAELVEVEGIQAIVEDPTASPALLPALAAKRTLDRMVSELVMALDRVTNIVDALKSHAHLDRSPVVDVDIAESVRDTLTILSAELAQLTVEVDIPPDLPPVTAYAGELGQVWMNLIKNAADAAKAAGGGTIRIRATAEVDTVVVEVEDDGIGIAEADRDRVFDAFYTSKGVGAGTGLGLKITHDIVVDRHGGSIEFDSQPGRTVFRVTLRRDADLD